MTYALITVPAPGAYAFALSQPFVKEHHRRLLVAHAAMPDLLAGVGQLGASSGVSGHSYVNLHYGVLGHRVSDFLGLDPPLCDRGPLWTAALAEGTRLGAGRRWYWRLYPQVREALDELGWLGR